jgi:hypothetical protein
VPAADVAALDDDAASLESTIPDILRAVEATWDEVRAR